MAGVPVIATSVMVLAVVTLIISNELVATPSVGLAFCLCGLGGWLLLRRAQLVLPGARC